jgi:DNA-binding NarL/FixJ family response regulator
MRILLIDDHRLFREAIAHVLTAFDDKAVLLEAGTAEEAIDMATHYHDLDLILLDLNMPGMGGLPGLPQLLASAPTVPIVVVSGSANVNDVRDAIQAGAAGFIPKTSSGREMSEALRLVLSGDIYVPPALLAVIAADRESHAPDAQGTDMPLTPRQLEVLMLLGEGLSNKSIARRLSLSEGTVKLHVNAVLRGLNARNRTGAVIEANRRGLLPRNQPAA